MILNALLLRYFTECGSFGDQLRHGGFKLDHSVCDRMFLKMKYYCHVFTFLTF